MGKFRVYAPEQAWLLPPSVEDILGPDHLSLFVHQVVERLDLRRIEESYSDEGQPGYHPKLLLKLWLYAYCLGVTSSRRLEQRTREDLGFRYLAGGAQPDFWTLNAFRKRHPKGLNDAFTQVVEFARAQGCARLGYVAIDSTRIRANASQDRIVSEAGLRREREKIRRTIRKWQKQCEREAEQEGGGGALDPQLRRKMQDRLDEIGGQLKQLRRAGVEKQSQTDRDSRLLRERGGFVLGYTGEIAVSEDHVIVAQRVTQAVTDHGSFNAVLDQIEERYRSVPEKAGADSGYYTSDQLEAAAARGVDAYVPDHNLARELNGGPPAETIDGCVKRHRAVLDRMREKLRSAAGRQWHRKRKATVEAVFGVLKEQRHGRRFRLRGLPQVSMEFCLMTMA